MQAKAFVLIEAESGQVQRVVAVLREVKGIAEVDAVTGPYDIIAMVATPDARDVGRLVMNDIHGISGIKRTMTCLTIG